MAGAGILYGHRIDCSAMHEAIVPLWALAWKWLLLGLAMPFVLPIIWAGLTVEEE